MSATMDFEDELVIRVPITPELAAALGESEALQQELTQIIENSLREALDGFGQKLLAEAGARR